MPPVEITIRPYSDGDWDAIARIHDAARLDELRGSAGVEAFLTLAQTADGEGMFDGLLWVAEVDGRVVGHVAVYELEGDLREAFVAATGTEDLAELAVLFVAADAIGSGIGGRLHDTAVDWIVSTGRQPVLDVVPVHARAVEVYRHRGWEAVGEVRPVWLAEDFPMLTLMTLSGRR